MGVHLVLLSEGRVLLGQRLNTTYAEGKYHLPAGHVEAVPGESLAACARREADEELGIGIDRDALELVHVHHSHDLDDGRNRVQVFFRVRSWTGRIRTAEPDKCAGWEWHPLDDLPEPIVDYTAQALGAIRRGTAYSEDGWSTP